MIIFLAKKTTETKWTYHGTESGPDDARKRRQHTLEGEQRTLGARKLVCAGSVLQRRIRSLFWEEGVGVLGGGAGG